MKTLVIAEHHNNTISHATRNTIGAAKCIGHSIDILLMGKNCDDLLSQLKTLKHISQILVADDDRFAHLTPENMTIAIAEVAQDYSHILAPATAFGKNLLPRLAGMLNTSMISDVIKIESDHGFIRPIYAGNAYSKINATAPIQLLTIRPNAFTPVEVNQGIATIKVLTLQSAPFTKTSFVEQKTTKSKRPELTQAKIVIAFGRGIQSKENIQLIETLADCLNAAIGASRAVVDAGLISNDFQVGQTGKVVSPDLYFAIGISGAIQHISGMKDSKTIIAINKDPDAPIFQIADFGLVGDLTDILPKLIAQLRK